MGGGGSKQGVTCKLEKRKLKQCSKEKTDLNNKNTNENTVCKDGCMPSRLESKSCLETFNGNTLRAPNLTDSHNSIPEESHRIATQPKWSNDSTEYLSKRNEQDNLSRELALTSSPHYISNEYYPAIKKPRSNTSDVILDQDKTFSTYPLENQEMSNSQNIDTTKSMSPTKTMFINSRSAMPRHSMYFLPLPLDFNDEETDSLSQLFPTENNECSVESSQNYLSDKTTPLNPCHITSNSILSHCSLTEGSSYGDDVRMKQLINSGDTLSPNRDSNFDINQSENYSNTLDSQDGINLSSSIEDIICRGGDLGDSGCHFDQLTKYFNTPSVKKVILDLSQMKYVGLSLVGGADSPFGNLPVLVKEIMPGGAAERCEIRRGDEIIGINSFSLEDKPLQSAVERLRHCSSRDQEIILWVIEKTD